MPKHGRDDSGYAKEIVSWSPKDSKNIPEQIWKKVLCWNTLSQANAETCLYWLKRPPRVHWRTFDFCCLGCCFFFTCTQMNVCCILIFSVVQINWCLFWLNLLVNDGPWSNNIPQKGWPTCPMRFYLRTYTPRFGLKLARLYPRFLETKEALPTISGPLRDSFSLFNELEWDWCGPACMKSVFAYLRGSTDLELGEWRALFPTHF